MPRKTRGKTTPKIVLTSRELRREQTPSEKKLWHALRDRRFAGLKFRRQHPFGHYILDIFCVEYQLEVEIDGDFHKTLEQSENDQARTTFLEQHGIQVLRFSNVEVENDLQGVLNKILTATKS